MSNVISKTAIIHEGVVMGDNVVIHDYVVLYLGVVIGDNVELFDHCVIGRVPKGSGATKRKTIDNFKDTVIGDGCTISAGVVIYTDVKVGINTLFGDNASVREGCIIGYNSIIARNVSVNYNSIIGDNTKIMDNSHITGNAIIEDHVFVAPLVVTTNDNSIGSGEYSDEREKGPYICTGVRIGAGANILPSIRIEKILS